MSKYHFDQFASLFHLLMTEQLLKFQISVEVKFPADWKEFVQGGWDI